MFRNTSNMIKVLKRFAASREPDRTLIDLAFALEEILSLNDFNLLIERLKEDIEEDIEE